MQSPSPQEAILGITLGFWQSRALSVVTDLEIADLLSQGPVSSTELAHRSGSDPIYLHRVLRALASIGIFAQSSTGDFINTPISQCLLKNAPGSLFSWIRSQLSTGNGFYEAWSAFGKTIQTGVSGFDQVFGQSFWEFSQEHPEAGKLFDHSMLQATQTFTPAITDGFDWGADKTIVDIGGGIGTQLVDILSRHVGCTGILFDQPHVLKGALTHPKMQSVSGDFFTNVPPHAEIYLLRSILHDWNDLKAIHLLKNIRKAATEHSTVVVAEIVLLDGLQFEVGKWSDLLMGVFNGGCERTGKQLTDLLAVADLEVQTFIPTASPLTLVVARPV